ncbi:hypothetical protein ACX12M_13165 [Cellulosimicrobium cellulans]
MLSFIETMAQWVSEHANGNRVQIAYREGPTSVPKREAVVGFETEVALGSFAVWETGEVEAEVLVVETLERPLVISAVVTNAAELVDMLDHVVELMGDLY